MGTRKSYHFFGREQLVHPIPSGAGLQFEFDESDICRNSSTTSDDTKRSLIPSSRFLKKPAKRGGGMAATSLPVNIPDWSKILGDEYMNHRRRERVVDDHHNAGDDFDGDDDEDDDDDYKIPPHEYLARTRVASFSVHEGVGRTLKGRDLSRVRNAIWKQTGFED